MQRWCRSLLQLAAATIALPLIISQPAIAQSYPNRYVRLVVPFPPGGGGDAIGRPLANGLSEAWGQQVVVENKGGAGGNIGSQSVAQASPDGYTLLLGGPFLAINPWLYPTSGYDPIANLAPVSLVTIIPNLMMVPNASPARSVAEFIAYARSKQGNATFASTGIGASPHLSGELFKRMAGVALTHVPYRGAGPALNDLIPGRVDAMFSNLPGVLPQAQSGTIRGLAVTSAKRSAATPEIPTIAETLPGYKVSSWWGVFAPAGTPLDIVAKIHSDTVAALVRPSVKQRLEAIGAPPISSTPQELAALLKADMQKWGPIIKEAGIKPE
jgi:tripartite-type tricarboxylate transporter receptor subunit TctC